MTEINLSSLQKRLLSGFTLGPVVVLIVLYGGWPFSIMAGGFASVALYEWSRLCRRIERLKALYLFFGAAYILLCFFYLYALRAFGGFEFALVFIALVWSSDIGAYAVGKKIGGPKMAPKISPNKTWAGLVGACAAPAVLGGGLMLYIDLTVLSGPSLLILLAFVGGAFLGMAGQMGDLLVSFVKRKSGAKDAGDVIPGHGGVLDRVDSMMLVAPLFYYFVLMPWMIAKSYVVM
ncbi:MAG: phosphatidate cytidylyltransferase [Alphaproteobacteria bacterium]